MHFGLFAINNSVCADPDVCLPVAQLCESKGFESVWTGEHVVLPDPQVAPSPLSPTTPMLDPAVALAYIAGHTTTLKLGTGIIIVPQRNPLVLAKEMASLDVLSRGRLLLGVGVGYLEPEFSALGISMDDRGARTIEYLEAMRAIWDMDAPAYEGRFVSFSGVQAYPRPVQRPTPPIHMGGHGPAAFRRSVTHSHGWYGFALTVDQTASMIAGLRHAADHHERPADLGVLEISVTPRGPLDASTVAAYAALGVHRLIPLPDGRFTRDELLRYVDETAALISI